MMDLLREGAPQRKKLDAIRAEITAKAAQIEATINADAADIDLREHCRRAVEGEIERSGGAAQFEKLRWSDALVQSLDFPGQARLDNVTLPKLTWGAVLFLLGSDRATQALFDATKRDSTKPPGLPNAEREKRIAELRTELAKLERAEEIEVLKLEAAGFNLLRRGDIDPEILFSEWASYSEAPAAPEAEAEAA